MKLINKHTNTLIVATILLVLSGCTKFLNKAPVDVITEAQILTDPAAFTSNMAYLYSLMPFEDWSNDTWLSYYTDDMVQNRQGMTTTMEYDFNSYGSSYILIRALNDMIAKVPLATTTAFATPEDKTQTLGELMFMRAYVYFSLAQRYGGVPIIKAVEALPSSGPSSELFHARDNESDVWKFVENQMDSAINMMSTTPTVYRFNKWSGLAFETRAMLYAASIANYGSVQLNGVVGIPQSEALHYYEAARDAAKLLMDSGTYGLYNQNADKVQNYHDLFFDKSASNNERIFVDAFIFPIKGYHFDLYGAPFSHRGGQGYGGSYNPTFDLVSSYEYTNNSNGALKLNDVNGKPIIYTNPVDLFNGKDPRFFASILFPGSPWMGTTLQIFGNTIQGGVLAGGTGADGLAQPESTPTSFYLLKWLNPTNSRPITDQSTDLDYMIIRYAEVLLDYAEAQLELGDVAEATTYVNMIRERAGVPGLVDPVTMDEYRHERRIELDFEGSRYWDLIRWRTFTTLFNNKNTYALWPIFDMDNNTYTFEKQILPPTQYTRTFGAQLYYNQLGTSVLSSNPLLVENPGY